MATCAIQWIDNDGNPTPDTRDAAATIRLTRDTSKVYPCCAVHLAQMPRDGSWEIVERFPDARFVEYFSAWHNTGGNGFARAVYVRRDGKAFADISVMSHRCMVDLWFDGKRIAEGLPAPTLRAAKAIGNRWFRVMRLFDAVERNARTFKWWTFGLYRVNKRAARMRAINRSAMRTEAMVSRQIGIA